MSIEIYKLDWDMYFDSIDELEQKIDFSKYTKLISINRGGNIIATIFSHRSGLHLDVVGCASEVVYEINTGDKALVIDDVVDTGSTLKHIGRGKRFKKLYDVACLHVKPHCKIRPDYYVEEISDNIWITYPYETESSTKR